MFHLRDGTARFNKLRRIIPAATRCALTNQLRELEVDGLIDRTVHPVVPPKVEYNLSGLGRSLKPILMSLKEWGDKNISRSARSSATAA